MKKLISVLAGEVISPPPVWLMRQAGRYLPEYRALRAEKGSFLNLCYDPKAAAEVTLQPIRRFGFDGAILFSDILIIPHALGQDLTFAEGEGPRLSPRLDDAFLEDLTKVPERLTTIYDTVAAVKADLPAETTLIGFAGAPWTVATYMVAGQGSRDQGPARILAYKDPARFSALIGQLIETTVEYLSGQIKAGAEAIMLFDSWSGALSPTEFERWVITPTVEIVKKMHALHPETPIIGFPKGAHEKLPDYARETDLKAVGMDEALCPKWAVQNLPKNIVLQGNLDPVALLAGGKALDDAVDRLLDVMQGRPHIFNLGHGINRFTPIPHVEQLLARIRG